jgi:hypothetical protein
MERTNRKTPLVYLMRPMVLWIPNVPKVLLSTQLPANGVKSTVTENGPLLAASHFLSSLDIAFLMDHSENTNPSVLLVPTMVLLSV